MRLCNFIARATELVTSRGLWRWGVLQPRVSGTAGGRAVQGARQVPYIRATGDLTVHNGQNGHDWGLDLKSRS